MKRQNPFAKQRKVMLLLTVEQKLNEAQNLINKDFLKQR